MVKAGRAESVGEAVDKAVEMARRLDNRATLERQTTAYFKGLNSKAAAEEADLDDALSTASQELGLNRATLERQTTAYFKGLNSKAAAEEADLDDALSTASQELDFDQP